MIFADVKADIKQQEIKELVALSRNFFYFQNLKYNVKQAHIFHLMLLGIPTGVHEGYLTDKIC